MFSRSLSLCYLILAGLLLAAGCDQGERLGVTAEVDDTGYKRGKDLRRQGRNQEALSAFLKVIERRGDDSSESHLEAGLLYAEHFKDPIAAIYHFKKCRELKPNSPTAELVRPQIEAAKREFASTLPGDPLSNSVVTGYSGYAQLEKLQRENEGLRNEVATLRLRLATQLPVTSPTTARSTGDVSNSGAPMDNPLRPPADRAADSTVVSRSGRDDGAVRNAAGVTPGISRAQAQLPPPTPAPSSPPGAGRKHTVVKGDTLYSLAAKYYGGNRSRWKDIFAANQGVMKSMNDLQTGVELVIPP